MGVPGRWQDFLLSFHLWVKWGLKIRMWVCGWAEMPPRMFDRLYQLELLDPSSGRTWLLKT